MTGATKYETRRDPILIVRAAMEQEQSKRERARARKRKLSWLGEGCETFLTSSNLLISRSHSLAIILNLLHVFPTFQEIDLRCKRNHTY